MEKQRINAVGFKGELRKCLNCGDVKIWDYPNQRKCPYPTNSKRLLHRWRPIQNLTNEEEESIDKQIEEDKKVKHRKQIIINSEEDFIKAVNPKVASVPLFDNKQLNSGEAIPPTSKDEGIRNGRII